MALDFLRHLSFHSSVAIPPEPTFADSKEDEAPTSTTVTFTAHSLGAPVSRCYAPAVKLSLSI